LKAMQLISEAVMAGARKRLACETLGLTIRTLQRWQNLGINCEDKRKGPTKKPSNALSGEERKEVLTCLNSAECRNLSPNQIVPKLADKGEYLCSEKTMYRILAAEGQLTHRQKSKAPEKRVKPSHVAGGPNQVYSWDITYLKTTVRGIFLYLYLAMDIWSRKIVGWQVHAEESMELGAEFAEHTCMVMGVDPEGIVWHADNGGPMKGCTMLAKLQQLGLVPSFSRPHVSDDNPFSESLFRTLKYRPEYPTKPFASIEEAREWVEQFVRWYNTCHQHSSIRFVTPDDRHYGREKEILANRKRVYQLAKQKHPDRWSKDIRNWDPVGDVYLNPDKKEEILLAEKLAA